MYSYPRKGSEAGRTTGGGGGMEYWTTSFTGLDIIDPGIAMLDLSIYGSVSLVYWYLATSGSYFLVGLIHELTLYCCCFYLSLGSGTYITSPTSLSRFHFPPLSTSSSMMLNSTERTAC